MASMHARVADAYERIRPLVRETPVEESAALADRSGATVLLKLERLQHTGSFKFRGASNKIALLTVGQAARGVVAASNGNHGLGVAAAARTRSIAAEVFVSSSVSPAKARRIESLGARIRTAGADPLTAELAARHAAELANAIPLKKGEPLRLADVHAAIERLYATGAFDDIQVDADPAPAPASGVIVRIVTKNSWFVGN